MVAVLRLFDWLLVLMLRPLGFICCMREREGCLVCAGCLQVWFYCLGGLLLIYLQLLAWMGAVIILEK